MTAYFTNTYQRSFGTYPLTGQELTNALNHAFAAGYRAVDTAQMYGNEADVGTALTDSGIARDELFITTKVHPDNFTEARFIPSVEQSLRDLQIDKADVLLLHWPALGGDNALSLKLLAEAKARGLATHIGISNYTAQMMRDAKALLDEPLITNQVEFHPLLDQRILLSAAQETGIPLASYCSVARGEVFKYPLFAEIGVAHNKSAAQVVLRWILQKGVSINTMSTKPENIRANFDLMDFSLNDSEMQRIDDLNQTGFRIVSADKVAWAPDWD